MELCDVARKVVEQMKRIEEWYKKGIYTDEERSEKAKGILRDYYRIKFYSEKGESIQNLFDNSLYLSE